MLKINDYLRTKCCKEAAAVNYSQSDEQFKKYQTVQEQTEQCYKIQYKCEWKTCFRTPSHLSVYLKKCFFLKKGKNEELN